MQNKDLNTTNFTCWICNSTKLKLFKKSNITSDLTSKNFTITDYIYGFTAEIHKCTDCGFIQCSYMKEVLNYYKDLEDEDYESTRNTRKLQMRKILEKIKKLKSNGYLLDVGAGSGILIEEAIKMGYKAEGIEPSNWLYHKAKEHKLPIILGTINDFKPTIQYDIITLIDVIEHISNPMEVIEKIFKVLKKDGVVITVTPDIGSIAAFLLGRNWWHYRIAHIGYFNKRTLNKAFEASGFKLIKISRPSWYFTGDYLLKRINKYLPSFLQLPIYSFVNNVVIPLNLGDSILGIYTPK